MGRVLVACEFSGTVRDAFRAAGHEAWSCDLLPTEVDGPHYQGDVRDILGWGWDLMVAHPPCTYLAVSGARWFAAKAREQAEALAFVLALLAAPIPRICLENPVSVISSRIRKPDQIIQPWQFGHPESKTTCLWLQWLPALQPTKILTKPATGRWLNQTPTGQNRNWTITGSLAASLADLRRHRGSDGRPMGTVAMTDSWPTSTSLSAWLAAERARASSGSHRAWIDEALRQAQAAGTLRAELQHALASVQSLQHVLDVLAQRLQQVLDEDGQ